MAKKQYLDAAGAKLIVDNLRGEIDTLGSSVVKTVNGVAPANGAITITKATVGLNNVDNTSDLEKPISNATKMALDDKVDRAAGKGLSSNDFTNTYKGWLDTIMTTDDTDTIVNKWSEVVAFLDGVSEETTFNEIVAPISAHATEISQIQSYTINGKKIKSSPTLGAADIALATDWTIADTYSDPKAGDTIADALAYLAKRANDAYSKANEATSKAGVTKIGGLFGEVKLDTATTTGKAVKFSVNASTNTISATVNGVASDTQGSYANSALQTVSASASTSEQTSGKTYISASADAKSGNTGAKTQAITVSLKTLPLSKATADLDGVATAYDVATVMAASHQALETESIPTATIEGWFA